MLLRLPYHAHPVIEVPPPSRVCVVLAGAVRWASVFGEELQGWGGNEGGCTNAVLVIGDGGRVRFTCDCCDDVNCVEWEL